LRGTLAIYATIGLALYLAELAYHTYDAGAEISVSTYYAAPTDGLNNITIVAVSCITLRACSIAKQMFYQTQLQPSNTPIYLQTSMRNLPNGLSANVLAADGTNSEIYCYVNVQFWLIFRQRHANLGIHHYQPCFKQTTLHF
jgi:hypothetical protein